MASHQIGRTSLASIDERKESGTAKRHRQAHVKKREGWRSGETQVERKKRRRVFHRKKEGRREVQRATTGGDIREGREERR
jgi:hypothetical protein